MSDEPKPVGVGLVGYGYWGPNLARNFIRQADCQLVAIHDSDPDALGKAGQFFPLARLEDSFDDLLSNRGIDAIAIATPVSTHFELASRALQAGKDVLVEKPLAHNVAEAKSLIEMAEKNGSILAVDHTFLYSGAVRKIRELIESGSIGEIIYLDSVRINLGLFQHDVNVVYDLAPHDLSIALYQLGQEPVSVQVSGKPYSSGGKEALAYIHMEFANGVVAHFHVSWISPVKIRRMVITGTKKMIIYDDLDPMEKVRVYDKSVVIHEDDTDSVNQMLVDYRTGDMIAPKLSLREALDLEAEEFIKSVRSREAPVSDGRFGLKVMKILEACCLSLKQDGRKITMEEIG